jgi:acyl transferase domain-containing protein/acyl carrier protein
VSAFGIGGTNAHAVLEEAPSAPKSSASRPWQLLVLSARSAAALNAAAERLADHLDANTQVSLPDVAHTLRVGRRAFAYRSTVVCRDAADAAQALRRGGTSGSVVDPATERSVVFLFSGQGSQYPAMARELYRDEPSFRADVDECCDALTPLLGCDLRTLLFAEEGSGEAARLKETRFTQPALFVVEYAMARLWMGWGIRPAAMLGHSVGEYVAACLAGVFSLEDALALVATRGRLMQALPAGAMLAVPLSEAELTPLLGAGLSIAAVNAPGSCVASGPVDAIAALEARLAGTGAAVRRLETSHAFHSAMMDPVLDAFAAAVANTARRAPVVPFISNLTGTWITEDEATDPQYWVRHLRQAVRFAAGAAELLKDANRVFLEIGPGRTLASLLRQQPAARGRTILTSLRHPQESRADLAFALDTLGQLWRAGVAVDWAGFAGTESRRRVPLPTYPFERKRYWIEAKTIEITRPTAPASLLAKNSDIASWFYAPSWTRAALEPSAPQPAGAAGPWLTFVTGDATCDALLARLRRRGEPVVTVQAGEQFGSPAADTYTIRPGVAADYDVLVAALQQAGRLPRRIVHLWSLGPADAKELAGFARAQDRGFHSVLFLTQAIGRLGRRDPLDLVVVGEGMRMVAAGDVVAPEKTAVLALSVVISQEQPHIRCATVDVGRAAPDGVDALADSLAAELIVPHTGDAVAYRGTQRWVLAPQPLNVAGAAGGTALRERGVYLITGGLGHIGLAVAARLARDVGARLVLIGRTTPPPRGEWDRWIEAHAADDRVSRQIAAVRHLESLGSEVLVCAADVADGAQMRAAIDRALDRFGAVHGVIHAAGLLQGGFNSVQTLSPGDCDGQFAPKVAGLAALDEATANLTLDFCLLTSSISALLGGLGYGAYAAANQVLDSFVERRAAAGGRRWISVNLDGWAFDASAVSTATGALEMSPDEGVEALMRILGNSSLTRVVVSTGSLSARLDRYVRRAAPAAEASQAASTSRYERPELATAFIAPTGEIERTIAAVWQEALGIESIGRDDNFFDLGGHSLLLIQVQEALAARLGRAIPVTDLFQFSTIASLAAHLAGVRRDVPVVKPAVERPSGTVSNAVAIIGMAGRFPGAPDVAAFWHNLRNGVESIAPVSDEDLRAAGVPKELSSQPQYVKAASTFDGVDLFDAAFFGYSPREAELIDPQHRLFLECAWEAFEQAGYDPKQYAGLIGVYAGTNSSEYYTNVVSNPDIVKAVGTLQAAINNRGDHLPTRVSYKLGLRGPSVNVQTACSTSLVAVHQACRSLVDGECDMALAGGASIGGGIYGRVGYIAQEDGILSPDGHCRAFDAQAQGTVWGDAVGVVVLKRLADAIADGDTIHAVIRGSAINNDGSARVGYSAPSVDGQTAVITRALRVAGVDPSQVSYVEAHGTGTTLGDPIEVAALTQAFGQLPAGTCAIGTVKSNVGHLDAAAGVTGLIKTTLALEHHELPPSLHFTTPNPKIDFAHSPFFVNTRLRSWEGNGALRRAGVSAFGMGGTNAHAVLEEAPAPPGPAPSRPWQVITLSARSAAALEAATGRLADFLDANPEASLADVAHTLHVGRRSFAHRLVVVAGDAGGAARALRHADHHAFSTVDSIERTPVFMFSGQGAQYVGMGRELYRDEPEFRADVDYCCERLAPELGSDLREVLYPAEGAETAARERLTETRLAQPALFVIEYAVARMWMRWGIRPAAFIGHSLGEYVAACLSGVFSLDDALRLVAARGRLMQALPAGAMIAVPLAAEELQPLLDDDVSLAAVNGPALCVVSGPFAAIETLETRLAEQGVAARRLETSHAFHSAMMEPALDAFAAAVERTERRAPAIPFISNLTGTWITAAEATDPRYWARHLRHAVRFGAGVQELLKDTARIFLEVGPGKTLASLLRQQPAARGRVVLTSLRHPQETQGDLLLALQTLGRLWLAGAQVDWQAFNAGEVRRRMPLPTYPFERRRYWIVPRALEAVAAPARPERAPLADWFHIPSWKRSMTLTPRLTGAGAPQRWALFADAAGFADRIAAFLAVGGRDVTVIEAGNRFERLSSHRYVIDPADADHYVRLLHDITSAGALDAIGHFWGYSSETPAEPLDSPMCLERGFYSLVFLAQALGNLGTTTPVNLAVVTTDVHDVTGDEILCPSKATILGPCRVIPAEYPHVTCRAVDLISSEWLLADNAQIEELVAEMVSGASISAYRRGRRWLEALEAVRFDEVPAVDPIRLRQHGVYLITGGLGGVGLTLAQYLAQSVNAHLVLIGRHGLPEKSQWAKYVASHDAEDRVSRQIHVVDALERTGAEVTVVAADVANVSQMRALVEDVRRRLGRIDGVIHAAGVPGAGIIQLKTTEAADQVLAPKVGGTQALSQAVAGLDLDFFILCSSTTAIWGGGGQVDYCAANSYLDAFAHEYARRTGTYTVAINWDAWQGVGMAVNTAVSGPGQLAREREELLKRGIMPAEGVEVFRRILSFCTIPQVVVSTMPIEPVRKSDGRVEATREAGAVAPAVEQSSHERPAVSVAYAEPTNDIERTLCDIWQQVLGISGIGIHDNFFELGGHSLLAMQLTTRVQEAMGTALRLTAIFQAPTIAEMSDFVLQQLLESEGSEAAEALLGEVTGLGQKTDPSV